jgi:hypothetical protein
MQEISFSITLCLPEDPVASVIAFCQGKLMADDAIGEAGLVVQAKQRGDSPSGRFRQVLGLADLRCTTPGL